MGKNIQVGICAVKLPVRNPSKDVEEAKNKWLWSSEDRSMLGTTMVPWKQTGTPGEKVAQEQRLSDEDQLSERTQQITERAEQSRRCRVSIMKKEKGSQMDIIKERGNIGSFKSGLSSEVNE